MSRFFYQAATLLDGGPTALVVKATLILASSALAALVLHRAAAAFRHLIWLLGLSACVALVLLTPSVPAIALRVPTHIVAPHVPPPAAMSGAAVTVLTPHVADSQRGRGTLASVPMTAMAPAIVGVTASPPIPSLSFAAAQYIAPIVLAVWLLGCLLILVRALLGHRHVRRIVTHAQAPTSPEWVSSLLTASDDLALTSRVELLVSASISAPITSGFIRPVVILPLDCSSWTAERRRIVLVHELAHVARLDYLAQLVATLTCAIFWFHPVVWFAAARLRAEAEHAADDRVIAAGTLGVTYATHLLEIARGDSIPRVSPAIAVGMLRTSRLEGRFRAMLDSTRSRAGVSLRLQAGAASLMLCAMVPLSGLRTVARATTVKAQAVPPESVASIAISGSSATPAIAAIGPRTVVVSSASSGALAMSPASASTISTSASEIADSTFEKTVEANSGSRLTIDLRTGGAIVLHGWDEPRVRLVAGLAGRDWRDTRVDLSSGSGGVRLRSEVMKQGGSQVTSHRFELWVPRHIDVEISSAGGALAINDLSGEFTGHIGGGNITIERSSGRANLSTGGGSVIVMSSDLSGSVNTGAGEVNLSNVTGGLRGGSGTGYVTAGGFGSTTTVSGSATGYGGAYGAGLSRSTGEPNTVATTVSGGVGQGVGRGISGGTISSTTVSGGYGGTITSINPGGTATTVGVDNARSGFGYGGGLMISKAGGEIILDDAPTGGVVHTAGGKIVVRSSGGSLAASTGGGDIELQRVSGNASAATGAGDVRITVVNANGTEHLIDVNSGKGRVEIELPSNLDARIELETAYTDNFNRRTTIESDFALDRSETRDWDDRYGTPRKYVRATGVAGNGAGLIRVRTVNGDVIVRRR